MKDALTLACRFHREVSALLLRGREIGPVILLQLVTEVSEFASDLARLRRD